MERAFGALVRAKKVEIEEEEKELPIL